MPLIIILIVLLLIFGGGRYYMGPGLGYYGGGGISIVLAIIIIYLLFGRGRSQALASLNRCAQHIVEQGCAVGWSRRGSSNRFGSSLKTGSIHCLFEVRSKLAGRVRLLR